MEGNLRHEAGINLIGWLSFGKKLNQPIVIQEAAIFMDI